MVTKREPVKPYEGFGEELSVDSAFLQAAALIDLAGKKASNDCNVDEMLKVAEYWILMGERIVAAGQPEEEGYAGCGETNTDKPQIGFAIRSDEDGGIDAEETA